jgi:glycosyltransferase involved in cell wall biosynthesis
MLISIITINYNDAAGLKKTMASVLEQTYEDIEYLVIDGGSTDGSASHIELYQKDLAYWVSEPDQGIYSAMNKGIDQSTGDYLLFLNSGDWLVDDYVIERFVGFHPIEDLVYGNVIYVHEDGTQNFEEMPSKLEGINIFTHTLNHQCIFHKRDLFNNKLYNLSYKMLADWAFYNEAAIINKKSYQHIDLIISKYDLGGFSSKPENKDIMEADRMLFYTQHADFLMPVIIKEYDMLAKKYRKMKRSKFVKMALKLQNFFK